MKFGTFVLLTACGLGVFALTMTFAPLMPAWADKTARGGLLLLFAVLWLMARGERLLAKYRPVFLAYFAVTAGLTLAYFGSDPILGAFQLSTKTPMGVALTKLTEAALIVAGVLITALLAGESFSSLYLRKGRLALGFTLGLVGMAVFVGLTFVPGPFLGTASAEGSASKLLALTPWVAVFIFSNAFMEELLFRGLVIGRLEPLMGKWLALLSTALVFALAHIQVTYTAQVAAFVGFVFALGLMWGWLMQKSQSIWGSVLFHAAADVAIILPIFQSMGTS